MRNPRLLRCAKVLVASTNIYIACSFVASLARGQGAETAPPTTDLVVVATVDDEAIYLSEVQRGLTMALGTRPIDESVLTLFQAKTLAQLIDRQLIVAWLRNQERGASETEIELEVTRLRKRLETREITLDNHLAALNMTEREMRRLIEWQIGWRKFLSRYQTDDNLEKYFKDHRREFDGTRLRVAHILLKPAGDDVEPTVKRAAELRESIVDGSLEFAVAAKQYSAAPTAKQGGDIGFIQRHKPMHETFSRAAFALNKGEISQPIVTPFGVHLIRCLEIEPGQRTWQAAREELNIAVTRYLFNWAASQQRPRARIDFTGALPHFNPGTEELVE